MTPNASSPQTAFLIMPLGGAGPPASALAEALGLDLTQYDLSGLTRALDQDRRCVVVWSDPASALAQALRDQTAPSQACLLWRQSAQDLLHLFARHRRRLLLVEARLICRADPPDIARLQARLAFVRPLGPVTSPAPDLPAQFARLISSQLSDLRPVWQELLASSLSTAEDTVTSADLDPLAQRLTLIDLEVRLLRDQLLALSEAVASPPASQPPQRRDQLPGQPDPAPAPAPDPAATPLGPAHAQVESAFATLLADLLTEKDLRLRAQQEARSATQVLQSTPNRRSPVPARPNS